MTYVQIVEGEEIIDKYVPDQCGECNKFLTKGGDCNSCGMSMCKGCGVMLDHGEPCEHCQPEEYLKYVDDDIKTCQHDNEVKSCDDCDDQDSYCFNGIKTRIEQELKEKESSENKSKKLKLDFESVDGVMSKQLSGDFIEIQRDATKHKYLLSDYVLNKPEGHFILLIGGHIGTGKSITALALAEDIDPHFNIDRIGYDVPDMRNLINSGMPEGSVILWEGDTKISQVTPSNFMEIQKQIPKIFEAIKDNNLILIITLANPNNMDDNIRCKIDGFMQMMEIKNKDFGWVRYFHVRYNMEAHKLIHRFLRIIDENGRKMIVKGKDNDSGNMKFALPSKDIVIAYDKLLSELHSKKESEQNG